MKIKPITIIFNCNQILFYFISDHKYQQIGLFSGDQYARIPSIVSQ